MVVALGKPDIIIQNGVIGLIVVLVMALIKKGNALKTLPQDTANRYVLRMHWLIAAEGTVGLVCALTAAIASLVSIQKFASHASISIAEEAIFSSIEVSNLYAISKTFPFEC